MNNQLTIQFSESQVKYFRDYNKSLAIIRTVKMSNASKNNFSDHIAWGVLEINMNTIISWDDTIYVYASENSGEAGTVIYMEAYKQASPKSNMYIYEGGYFNESAYSGDNEKYYAKNGTDLGKTIGLAQSFTVNGSNGEIYPFSARKMLAAEEAFFYEISDIGLCLVTNAQSGQIITISKNAISNISISSGESAVIIYDDNSNSFKKN